MGMYAAATIFYGYVFEEGEAPLVDEDGEALDIDDITANIARAKGAVDPWDDCPDYIELPYEEGRAVLRQWQDENEEAMEKWYAALREVENKFPVEIGSHCRYDYPMYYLAVMGTETNAHQGDPTPIGDLNTYSSWKTDLDAFMEEYGIEKPEGYNQPGWWMVSNYG